MELEHAGLGAAARRALKSAAPLVARPDRAPDSRRHMTPVGMGQFDRARTGRGGQPLPLELFEQHSQRAIENRSRITVGNLMTQQVLHPPELVVGVPVDGELHLVSFRGEWRDLGPQGRGNHGRPRRDCDLL